MKKFIVLLLVIILGISLLAGCGGSSGDNAALLGKYVLTSLEMDGDEMMSFLEMAGVNPSDMYIELLSGGKYTTCMLDFESDAEVTGGTFTVTGNIIRLDDADGTYQELKIEGGKLIAEGEGDPAEDGYSSLKTVFEK